MKHFALLDGAKLLDFADTKGGVRKGDDETGVKLSG